MKTLIIILILLPVTVLSQITNATFYQNLSYGDSSINSFDLWLPDTINNQPLVVFIHGGGFVAGSKEAAYNTSFLPMNQQFIDSGIAVATINHELLNIPDTVGINRCLSDISEFYDFINTNADSFKIDSSKIGFYGSSSGGTSALWMSFNDSIDPYVVGGYGIQATLDFVRWPEVFISHGIELNDILKEYDARDYIYALFAVSSKTALEAAVSYRESVDLMALMDSDDAPFWINNSAPDVYPTIASELTHSPLHARTLYDTSGFINLPSQCYIQAFSIADTANETLPEYFIRKLKE